MCVCVIEGEEMRERRYCKAKGYCERVERERERKVKGLWERRNKEREREREETLRQLEHVAVNDESLGGTRTSGKHFFLQLISPKKNVRIPLLHSISQ